MKRRLTSIIAAAVIMIGIAGCSDLTSPDTPAPSLDEAPEVQGSNT